MIEKQYIAVIAIAGIVAGAALVYILFPAGPSEPFCGTSTYGECETDADCATGGCSGEVCYSTSEEEPVTICDYRDCYNEEAYGLSCRCVSEQCQWA